MISTIKFIQLQKNLKKLITIGLVIGFTAFGLGFIYIANGIGVNRAIASPQEPADINDDNTVNIFDLSVLLSKWGTTDAINDLNTDGTVNIFDLSMLLSRWGAVGVPPETNLARITTPIVTVTASSQDTGAGQGVDNIVDGSLLGYPVDDSGEWATTGGGSGSWAQLTWASPVAMNRVVLYDRPNTYDQITGGNLIFSDGSTVAVPSLANDGTAVTVSFSARTVTNVRLNITSVSGSTANVGLAEFEAWGYVDGATNHAPTANAGTDQAAVVNNQVSLSGSSSSDPDGNTLTYAWTKTSGPAATLSSTTVANPTFTPSLTGTYVFSLTVNDGELSSAADTVTVTVGEVGTLPTSMKMISLNKPAYASAGTASSAVDSNYDTSWSPGSSGWLAIDLSSEPVSSRQSVVLAWFTNPDDGRSVNSYEMSCPTWAGRPYMSSYTVQINNAAGGGSAPTTGWQTVTTITGNEELSGQHLVALGGYNWIRVNGSGPNGIDMNIDVADASGGITDGWLFIGDSITASYSGHFSDNDNTGVERRSITEMVSAGSSGQYRPIQENGAMACAHSSGYIGIIDGMLDRFYGKYVTLNLGTNDGWDGGGDPNAYYNNMQTLVDRIRAKGKTAVVATIPWPNNGGAWQAGIEAMNAKIVQLYQNNPDVVRGPDLYAITLNKPNLYNGTGDVHFNTMGNAVARKAWVDSMLTNVYGQ